MARIKDILDILSGITAPYAQEEWDNSGFIFGRGEAETDKILLCLDVTGVVAEEAKDVGAGLIISHHPVIFGSVKSITDETVTGRILLSLAGSGTAAYCMHTPLDKCPEGINAYLCGTFGLTNIYPVEKSGGLAYCGSFSGSLDELKANIGAAVGGGVRIAGEGDPSKVLVSCGGGGGDTQLVDLAEAERAGAIVTADVKHHFALYALEKGVCVIECTHYSMERAFVGRWKQLIDDRLKAAGVAADVIISRREREPFQGF